MYESLSVIISILIFHRFVESEVAAEIYENKPVGTYVTHVQARSASSVFYDIIGGNAADMFVVNPSMGVILTKGVLDYETKKFYNLTIEAVNMVRICLL